VRRGQAAAMAPASVARVVTFGVQPISFVVVE
jgi:hypothetical protein